VRRPRFKDCDLSLHHLIIIPDEPNHLKVAD
jgi:hypothetical protein